MFAKEEKRGKGHALTFSTTVAGSTSGKIHIAASEKGIKEETWRNNEDISTLSHRNYRLSVQTQSPLLILSLEDMMLLVDAFEVRVTSCTFARGRLNTCRLQILSSLGVSKIKSKMARVEQQCATEGSTSSTYLQLSYFTIYLTQGIEILEYYTKVSYYLLTMDSYWKSYIFKPCFPKLGT